MGLLSHSFSIVSSGSSEPDELTLSASLSFSGLWMVWTCSVVSRWQLSSLEVPSATMLLMSCADKAAIAVCVRTATATSSRATIALGLRLIASLDPIGLPRFLVCAGNTCMNVGFTPLYAPNSATISLGVHRGRVTLDQERRFQMSLTVRSLTWNCIESLRTSLAQGTKVPSSSDRLGRPSKMARTTSGVSWVLREPLSEGGLEGLLNG
mmetsp:Transcript_48721/g.115689  ORF Transcript_48721/g.115689 Transcript_48721/m.115689 type:complete len:209 (-) Transcript_48721:51-677(-)